MNATISKHQLQTQTSQNVNKKVDNSQFLKFKDLYQEFKFMFDLDNSDDEADQNNSMIVDEDSSKGQNLRKSEI